MLSPGNDPPEQSASAPGSASGRNAFTNSQDWMLARRGIQLVLNNKFDEALECFKHKDKSIQLAAGHSFVMFLTALMTFEEERVNEAITVLKDLEKRCAGNLGWLKTVRQKFSFMSIQEHNEVERVEEQILLADCQVCLALLNGLANDSPAAYVRSGWALRKAWRLYQSTYGHLLSVYRKTFGVAADVPGSGTPSWRVILAKRAATPDSPSCPWEFPTGGPSTPSIQESYKTTFWNILGSAPTTPEVCMNQLDVGRLMGAVSLGYGLFHLVVSLVPPSLLRVMQLFGFGGDRLSGIDALKFARLGPDMRAPLATLALLWYHTIVRPFYSIDGHNMAAGADAASLLIDETKAEFGQSALFLFFAARIHRLKMEIDSAIQTYQKAMQASLQRELHLLCMHEIAWCRLIQLDFAQARPLFADLSHTSHWGYLFYFYCTKVCEGSLGNMTQNPAARIRNRTTKVRELDSMIEKRLRAYFSSEHESFYYRLLAYELLYMWNNMPCSRYTTLLIEDCERNATSEEPMAGLRQLSLGVGLSCTGDTAGAERCLLAVLDQRRQIPVSAPDAHIDVFALYELAVLKLSHSSTVDEAKAYLNRIGSYKNYDLEHQLSFRIHAAARIANEMAAERKRLGEPSNPHNIAKDLKKMKKKKNKNNSSPTL